MAVPPDTTTSPASSKETKQRHGKKRLSKTERKALKKKQSKQPKTTEDEPKEQQNENEPQKQEASPSPTAADTHQEDEIEPGYLQTFEAIRVPTYISNEISDSKGGAKLSHGDDEGGGEEGGGGKTTLGKWFPNALLVKCSVNYTNTGKLLLNNGPDDESAAQKVKVDNPKSSLVLFYQYTSKHGTKWSETQLKLLMTYLATVGKKRNLGGRMRVAQEGVNCTVSAVDMPNRSAKETLRHFTQDLRNFDSKVFSDTDFKFIDDLPADRHFKELKVVPVQELVFYGIKEEDAPLDMATTTADHKEQDGIKGGVHLDANEYHEMLKKDNTVVIDVRNHYETIIGRFDGQQDKKSKPKKEQQSKSSKEADKKDKKKEEDSQKASAGAEYIDPLMRKSTDFKSWLSQDATKEKLKDKTVLMYCTGGIRCERASAYLKKEMGEQVGGVYQLQGGVERYLKAFPDGGFWRGKNFVFDKREAVGVDNPEGDGGVVRKQKKTKQEKDSLPSKCCVCDCPWDRYVGKKKCYTCGVPVLMCDKCMSLKPDKTSGMELKVRCPLCVTEKVTLPASSVEFTANGIKGKVEKDSMEEKKAAGSVLKWGGGHAAKKKLRSKAKRRVCQFGSECARKDCFFWHPEREGDHAAKKKVKT